MMRRSRDFCSASNWLMFNRFKYPRMAGPTSRKLLSADRAGPERRFQLIDPDFPLLAVRPARHGGHSHQFLLAPVRAANIPGRADGLHIAGTVCGSLPRE